MWSRQDCINAMFYNLSVLIVAYNSIFGHFHLNSIFLTECFSVLYCSKLTCCMVMSVIISVPKLVMLQFSLVK